jgi:hypothetical protein
MYFFAFISNNMKKKSIPISEESLFSKQKLTFLMFAIVYQSRSTFRNSDKKDQCFVAIVLNLLFPSRINGSRDVVDSDVRHILCIWDKNLIRSCIPSHWVPWSWKLNLYLCKWFWSMLIFVFHEELLFKIDC